MGTCSSDDKKKKKKPAPKKSQQPTQPKEETNQIPEPEPQREPIIHEEPKKVETVIKENPVVENPVEEIPSNLRASRKREKRMINLKIKIGDDNKLEGEFDEDTLAKKAYVDLMIDPKKEYIIRDGEGNEFQYDPEKRLGELFPDNDDVLLYLEEVKGLNLDADVKKSYIELTKYLGFPLIDDDSFTLFTLNVGNDGTDKIQRYTYDLEKFPALKEINFFSAVCNGSNYLFISGGEKSDEGVNPDPKSFFYSIRLNECTEEMIRPEEHQLNEARSMHSMIFVPPSYVFIVGGNGKKSVELFNLETNQIELDSELIDQRSECSLCVVDNSYLYAFYGFLLHHTFVSTIERCNLLRQKREWESVSVDPNHYISPSQCFFASYLYDKDTVILFAERSDNDLEQNQNLKIKLNTADNDCEIAVYGGADKEISEIYKEKFFMPTSEESAFLFPLISDQGKILILNHSEGEETIRVEEREEVQNEEDKEDDEQ